MKDAISSIEKLINQGRYLEARSLARQTLDSSPHLRVSQLYALAVSKAGVPEAALQFLDPVYQQHPEDPETAGILGGIYKEIFRKTQQTKYALLSRDTYLANFTLTKNYYTGINAATMSVIAGQASRGREIASEVINLLSKSQMNFWEQVTLAEAYLLVKEREKALEAYFQAKKMVETDWGRISSVYNQLWLLNHYVPVPKEALKVFHPPGVVSFTGHMIDHPTRSRPRFPATIEIRVKEAIQSAINTLNAKIGFCSLACGSDILFAEAIIESGGELNIWIPFSKDDFLEESVRFAGGDWVDRFEKLLLQFPPTYLTQEPYAGFDDLFSFQNRVIFGSAVIRSAMNHTEPTLLTVLSETDLRLKEGGTRDTLNLWPFPGRHVNINPDNFVSKNTLVVPSAIESLRPKRESSGPVIDRPVLYIVCADIPGASHGEQAKIWEEIEKKMDLPVLAPVTYEVSEMMMISFRSILGAIDLTKIILKSMKAHFMSDRLRISLYANPFLLATGKNDKEKVIASQPASRTKKLHSLIPTGAVYAFARFSAALSLDVNHYSVDYAGLVTVDWLPQPLEIYKINITENPRVA